MVDKLDEFKTLYEEAKVWEVNERKKDKEEVLNALSSLHSDHRKAMNLTRSEMVGLNSRVSKLSQLSAGKTVWEWIGQIAVGLLFLYLGWGFLKKVCGY